MKKIKTSTILLIFMTIILMAAILVVGYIITRPTEVQTSIAPRKIKAQNRTYSKLIALNMITTTPANITPSSKVNIPTPSPTEIILSKAGTPS